MILLHPTASMQVKLTQTHLEQEKLELKTNRRAHSKLNPQLFLVLFLHFIYMF